MSLAVFISADPDPTERRVLELIDELRAQLQHRVGSPRRWLGSLRRVSFARAIQASNSIEGYDASLDDVVAAVDGEPTLDANVDTQLALVGYRDAMTYVLQLAQDPAATIDEGTLKALHFMMLKHDLTKSPGRWRPGDIFVRREPSGEIVYEGPSHELIAELIAAMLEDLHDDSAPALIRAATAHLNLVMIHPFRDGNGRMARCLQTLVLAREQIVAPVFSSIEEYLGGNTQAYYDVLAQVGRGRWHPRNDPRPWIRFCLTAHYRQAQTHLRRIEEAEALWAACADLAEASGLPERCTGVLYDAAFGFRLRNATYRALVERTMDEQVTPLTASRDLNALVRSELLSPVGEGRGRYYVGTPAVANIRRRIRNARPPRAMSDPFRLVSEQPRLFATGSPARSS
jgi:Fic family protein